MSGKFYIGIIILIVTNFFALNSYANRIAGENICIPIYSGIKNVIVDYAENTPYSGNFDKIIKSEVSAAQVILSHGNVVAQIGSQSELDASKLPENTALIKIVYSYSDKKSFSLPLAKNQIASWIEIYRNLKDENGVSKVVSASTKINFFGVTNTPVSNDLSIASNRLIEDVSCNIIQFSANKKCTNRQNFVINKIVDAEKKCVTSTDKDDQLSKIFGGK